MDDHYLWNRTGPADPFTLRLERSLAGRRAAVKAAGLRAPRFALPRRSTRRSMPLRWLAAAAILAATWYVVAHRSDTAHSRTAPSDPPAMVREHDAPERATESSTRGAHPLRAEASQAIAGDAVATGDTAVRGSAPCAIALPAAEDAVPSVHAADPTASR